MQGGRQKILVVFGTRPEAIKMAPLVRTLQAEEEHFSVRVCVTAQHRDMLDQVLDTFAIRPDYDLQVMQNAQDLYQVTALCLEHLPPVLHRERPDWVLVQGDTTTTFSAGLAAFYAGIPVGHVEAGLRTGDKLHPFPEEMNRRLTTRVADLHFAPTRRAAENLLREGVSERRIHVTGNTGIDALLCVRQRAARCVSAIPGLEQWSRRRRMILVTGHRRENFGEGFRQICQALQRIATGFDVDVIYPVHLNPNVQKPVKGFLGNLPNVFLIDPVDYISFVGLMDNAFLILTDSGGIQEEAPSLGKPVLVMREVTERPEAVEAGSAVLVGAHAERIVSEVARLLEDRDEYARRSLAHNPYGDGKASQRIARILASQPLAQEP